MDELGAIYDEYKSGYAAADAIISLQSIYYITFLGSFTFFAGKRWFTSTPKIISFFLQK